MTTPNLTALAEKHISRLYYGPEDSRKQFVAERVPVFMAFLTAALDELGVERALESVDNVMADNMDYEHAVLLGEDPASPECKTPAKALRATLATIRAVKAAGKEL